MFNICLGLLEDNSSSIYQSLTCANDRKIRNVQKGNVINVRIRVLNCPNLFWISHICIHSHNNILPLNVYNNCIFLANHTKYGIFGISTLILILKSYYAKYSRFV